MAGALTVRRAAPADREQVLALTDRLAAFPVPAWRTPQEIAVADHAILLAALDAPGGDTAVFVAEGAQATLDGMALVSTKVDYFTQAPHAHVEVLAVATHAEGRGVARALLSAAESWAAARGDHCITLNVFDANWRARGLYGHLGYRPETVHYLKRLGETAAPSDRMSDASPPAAAGAPRGPADVVIRPDMPTDADPLWAILHAVIAAGDTYAFPLDMPRADALAAWHPPGSHTFVAERHGRLLGTYVLKPNQPGLGRHVANCGYMVAPEARGQGLGAALCRHSLDAARAVGFLAMQFNAVVSTNTGAIALWQRSGFAIVGTVPLAFRHPTRGLVDIHVMHRLL